MDSYQTDRIGKPALRAAQRVHDLAALEHMRAARKHLRQAKQINARVNAPKARAR